MWTARTESSDRCPARTCCPFLFPLHSHSHCHYHCHCTATLVKSGDKPAGGTARALSDVTATIERMLRSLPSRQATSKAVLGSDGGGGGGGGGMAEAFGFCFAHEGGVAASEQGQGLVHMHSSVMGLRPSPRTDLLGPLRLSVEARKDPRWAADRPRIC